MCGIIACRTGRPAVDYLRVGLRRLEYRGYDSVGVALQTTSGDVVRLRTTGRIGALDGMLQEWAGARFGGIGIGHTRWATHGAVSEVNAHPHADCTGGISLVHNGIIENAESLRVELVNAGHTFATTVDSEVLCHLIEDERKSHTDPVDAVRIALARVDGSWALAVLVQGVGRIILAANHSPLVVAHTPHGDFAASDLTAIADWAEEYRILADGDVIDLSNVGDFGPAVARDVELDGYADHMAKEIDEQPHAIARLLDELGDGIATGEVWSGLCLPPFDRLRVIGCGTSLNAGNVIGNLARGLGGIPVASVVGSEAAAEVADTSQLCLALSESGETADVLRAVESSAVGASPLLVLTNNSHSTLARLGDAVIGCSSGPEVNVAAIKTFVCQIISGTAVMVSALIAMRRISARSGRRLVDDLRRVPDQLAVAATVAKCVIPPIVENLTADPGFIFIARGNGLPYAAEGALKLTVLARRWAEHHPAGELKHGPLALVASGTPVVVVDNGDPQLPGNLAEVERAGGRIVTIGSVGSSVPVVDSVCAPWGPIVAIPPLQIFARTLAVALGLDVDKTRNLVRSVTVE
ncbi:glutamine--fructose-6-phosphate transaminase (isomerizing) [Mycobacterium sp. NPDC050441]|uniref:glutamine--fructose-6-phosphate transaminase (isomerizing) n=1 Tax=Mycobacterium sp. NPDC050441 TaxID=3155403 RepID=UPI0033CF3C5E